jgi:hypothetical protein
MLEASIIYIKYIVSGIDKIEITISWQREFEWIKEQLAQLSQQKSYRHGIT